MHGTRALLAVFQFHKGTIKTLHTVFVGEEDDDFNSIKVRLRLGAAGCAGAQREISIP